ncbi:MAG: hypothetical protein AAF601_09290 [Pseudomonadota bacterium]
MRTLALLIMAALSACAPQYVETVASDPSDIPVRRATFAADPAPLDAAFRASCDTPGDEIRQISRGVLQCRIPPPPDLAAFLVLQYDGALAAPTLVVQKETEQAVDSVVVELSYFAEVVQKSGNPRRIYFRQRSLDALMDALLEATGGNTS